MGTKYQLCSRDEYGQTGIFYTDENLDKVMAKGKEEVTIANDNSLTAEEKKRNYEAYFVEMPPIGGTKQVYAGKDGHGEDIAYKLAAEGIQTFKALNSKVKIFIGKLDRKGKDTVDTYASDIKGNMIETLNHPDLNGKTAWFIRKV